jgi:hypothetical protein
LRTKEQDTRLILHEHDDDYDDDDYDDDDDDDDKAIVQGIGEVTVQRDVCTRG